MIICYRTVYMMPAVRNAQMARSWIRILFRVWQTGVPFDCDRYIERLKLRCPEITKYLDLQK